MSQLNVDSIKDGTGASQPDIVGVAKAFVNFNGTGTVAIRSGFNVSSITDNGTGDYIINFTNAFADTDYTMTFGACRDESPTSAVNTHNYEISGTQDGVSAAHVYGYQSNTATDNAVIYVAVFSN